MQTNLVCPKNYKNLLDLKQTEKAIRLIKEFFQTNLAFELNLLRVTAPLFVKAGTGINDDLNGIERPVSFKIKALDDIDAEIVQSLAKWKRMMLADYGFQPGAGIYTDMNAIRPDEELDNIHSLYVDQWDWEKVISKKERNLDLLKCIVNKIYDVIRRTEKYVSHNHSVISPILPETITYFHSEELLEMYPDLTPMEREYQVCKKYGAVFIIGIGAELADGKAHDGRAPDYDDWSSPSNGKYVGLNGDILVYNPILDCAYELSSMGIRVDKDALLRQLEISNSLERKELYFHQRLLKGELPLTLGGGIGQSRLCMYFLRKAHIGEIQSSIWPDDMIKKCRKHNIILL
ncbi:aspartate--ammonia ligase [candidate division KSB1 bacterium]|nr:aspartate--ammonia ligase [candidate division KSB1 bacterium]MBL7095092.1 aspartate--ammonia ligase [candidate division KSB1 bacterium]